MIRVIVETDVNMDLETFIANLISDELICRLVTDDECMSVGTCNKCYEKYKNRLRVIAVDNGSTENI